MHVFNDSFSSLFKRFKPYQDHIFVFVKFIVSFSRYRPRNGHNVALFNPFSIERCRNCACFCAFRHLGFENQSVFGHINRLFYSRGLLIAFFQILWAIIAWRTFLVSSANKRSTSFYTSAFWSSFFSRNHAWMLGVRLIHECRFYTSLYGTIIIVF